MIKELIILASLSNAPPDNVTALQCEGLRLYLIRVYNLKPDHIEPRDIVVKAAMEYVTGGYSVVDDMKACKEKYK